MHVALVILMILAIALVLVGVWRIPAPRPPLFRLLGLLTALALVVEVVGLVTSMQRINNAMIFNMYLTVEALLVPAMVLTQRPQWRPWLLAAMAVALAALGWNTATQGFHTLVLTTAAVTNALVFVTILLALLWHLANTSIAPLHRTPHFWVFTGLLVYFGGLVPVVGSVLVIFAYDERLAALMWHTIPLLSIVRYLLAAQGCRLQAQATQKQHERS